MKKIELNSNFISVEKADGDIAIVSLADNDDNIFFLNGIEKEIYLLLEKTTEYEKLISTLKENFEFRGRKIEEFLPEFLEKLAGYKIIKIS